MPQKFTPGWVRQPYDPRDFRCSFAPKQIAAAPPHVDLAANMPESSDQGNIGSCGPNATAHHIQYDMKVENFPAVVPPSRLFMYYTTRQLMGTVGEDSGVVNRTMMKSLNRYGWCPESMWPYKTSDFTKKPSDACFQEALANRILLYTAVQQDLGQMKASLASGLPFIFGFAVFPSMLSDEAAETGKVPNPGVLENTVGGHDVLICGYDDVTGEFKFKNSWGMQWGKSGYGTIPYKYALNSNLASDFWVINDLPGPILPTPPTPPTPTPTPTPPSPVPSSTVKEWVDAVFAFLKVQYANRPYILMLLSFVQSLVDNYLDSNPAMAMTRGINISDFKQIIDAVFVALEENIQNPFLAMAIKLIHGLVDQYIFTQQLKAGMTAAQCFPGLLGK